jgi:hypothetical protein
MMGIGQGGSGVTGVLWRGIAALAAVLAAALAAALAATESGAAGQENGNLLRPDSAFYWGADAVGMVGGRDFSAGIGFVTALSGDIGRPGFIVGGGFGLGRTRTLWNATDSRYAAFVAGHQWVAPSHYLSLSAGLAWRDKDEGGGRPGAAVGAVLRSTFETSARDAAYLQSYGAYSTIDDEVHFHVRLGRRMARLRFGGEFMLFDDAGNRPTLRYGAFLGDIPVNERIGMNLAIGYRHELEPGKGDGLYATIGFSMLLDLLR